MRRIVFLVLPLFCACSLAISDKENGRPCDAAGACPQDMACIAGLCVAGDLDAGPADAGPDGGEDGGVALTPCDPSVTDQGVLMSACGCNQGASAVCRAKTATTGDCLCVRLMGTFGGLSRTDPRGFDKKQLREGRLGADCSSVNSNGIQVCGGFAE